MSDQVISLTSSDEDEATEPPPKKRKGSPNLPECTVTLVSPKPIDSAPTIETVSLDSDEDISENKKKIKKKHNVEIILKSKTSTANVDLISLTDDEEEDNNKRQQTKVNKINGTHNLNLESKVAGENIIPQSETVSIDDSDTEIDTSKDIEGLATKEKANIEKAHQAIEKHHSIIIDDSDDETEKENHCEYEPIEPFPVQIDKTSASEVSSASTSKLYKKHLEHKGVSISQKEASWSVRKEQKGRQDELEEAKGLFKKFVRIIEEKIVDSTFEEILPKKVPIIKKCFNRSGAYVNDKAFKNLLVDSIETIKKSSTASGANSAVLAFHKVFEHLKAHVAETTIIVEEDNLPKIKKLEHTIKLLRKRIHELEGAEVNFDDDGDSAYIMLDKYQCRLNKVYAKYCQYIKRNPHSGRATYDRITFVNSSYNEINQAITRKYKNSVVFPSYFELESYIRKIVKKEKLNLSDNDIKIESKKCFKVLGNILQKKRRQELYDSHLDFVESSEDPAAKDISLENVLKKNHVEGQEKFVKIYQKYVNKQERGEDHVSSDEEQSTDESDNEKIKKGKVKKISKVKIKKNSDITVKDNKHKKGNQDKQNDNTVENNEVENIDLNNGIDQDTKDSQKDEINLDDKLKNLEDAQKQKEETLEKEANKKQDNQEKNNADIGIIGAQEETPEKEANKKQDNQEENIKNKADIGIIRTQEEFLSVLNIQKQPVEDKINQDDITVS